MANSGDPGSLSSFIGRELTNSVETRSKNAAEHDL